MYRKRNGRDGLIAGSYQTSLNDDTQLEYRDSPFEQSLAKLLVYAAPSAIDRLVASLTSGGGDALANPVFASAHHIDN